MKVFDELFLEFREGRVIEERDEFFLCVAPQADWETSRQIIGWALEELGFIRVADGPGSPNPGYYVFAPVVRRECGEFTQDVYLGPFKKFRELAARAGDALPSRMRQQWPVQPTDAVDVWLTYLWHESRPAELGIRKLDGGPFEIAPSWERPFSESAEAIVNGKLCSPEVSGTLGHPDAGSQAPNVHPATLAKAILLEEPDISPTSLAKRVGVSPGTLYKKTGPWADVRATLTARKGGKCDSTPRGFKDREGGIEAEHGYGVAQTWDADRETDEDS